MNNSLISGLISRIVPPLIGVRTTNVLSVLVYHRVVSEADYLRPGVPTVKEFSWQMELLSKYFNPLSLSEALRRLKDGSLPPRSVCVTFDDGYADNLELAWPILEQWSVPATFYVATGFLDGGRMWNDTIIEFIRRYPKSSLVLENVSPTPMNLHTESDRLFAAHQLIAFAKYMDHNSRVEFSEDLTRLANEKGLSLGSNLMLSSNQLLTLSQRGATIGGHTVTHPILREVGLEQARLEIEDGRSQLETLIQKPVVHFAYPNGIRGKDFDERHERIVRGAGFHSAVTTHWGASNSATKLTAIPRFTPWDKIPSKFALRMALNMRRTAVAE